MFPMVDDLLLSNDVPYFKNVVYRKGKGIRELFIYALNKVIKIELKNHFDDVEEPASQVVSRNWI